jgi:hypothetical protein
MRWNGGDEHPTPAPIPTYGGVSLACCRGAGNLRGPAIDRACTKTPQSEMRARPPRLGDFKVPSNNQQLVPNADARFFNGAVNEVLCLRH